MLLLQKCPHKLVGNNSKFSQKSLIILLVLPSSVSSIPIKKDMIDRVHNYFAVGAVWYSMLGYFSHRPRVIDSIEGNIFITKDQASQRKLPVEEINSRCVYHACQV